MKSIQTWLFLDENQEYFSESQNHLTYPSCNDLSMFSFPKDHNDDPFNLNNSSLPKYSSNKRHFFRQQIEEQLKMLTEGNEQNLIDNYERNFQKRQDDIEIMNLETDTQKSLSPNGESKNIPKNFGKQIIKFVKQNEQFIVRMLIQTGSTVKYNELKSDLEIRKKKMRKIGDLRQLWTKQNPYSKEMRIISQYFLRHHGLNWIFNSRVIGYRTHLKYRLVLQGWLKKPEDFVQLKSDV